MLDITVPKAYGMGKLIGIFHLLCGTFTNRINTDKKIKVDVSMASSLCHVISRMVIT